MPVRILCASAELAVEALRAAELIGWKVETEVASDPLRAAAEADGSNALGIALVAAPTLEQLVALGHRRMPRLALATLERSHAASRLCEVALDLGITAVADVAELIAALRLLQADIAHPWAASLRSLPEPDRARLRPAQTEGARSGASFVPGEHGVAFANTSSAAPIELGRASDVAAAVAALRDTDRTTLRVEASVDGVDSRAVLDVLFGPRRALSDPASKSALMPYGIPLPTEELCASASRAAVEAGRIGFPVRISLASPDLRVWDHADLSVDMVDNAARVRDTFRQLMGLAKARMAAKPSGLPAMASTVRPLPGTDDVIDRVLGVMVTATAESRALLGARAWPLPEGRVAMEIAFADTHGAAADDRTLLVMPATVEQIERALMRLAGHALILGSARSERRAHLEAIADVLHRLSAFVHDRRREVTSVELRPLALLLDGTIEAREACVTVSDAFERMLYAPPSAAS